MALAHERLQPKEGMAILEVIVRQADNKLHHYFRERVSVDPDVFEWKIGDIVSHAENVMSGPSFIQGTLGHNFELVVREDGGVRHYFGKINAQGNFEWEYGDDVAQ